VFVISLAGLVMTFRFRRKFTTDFLLLSTVTTLRVMWLGDATPRASFGRGVYSCLLLFFRHGHVLRFLSVSQPLLLPGVYIARNFLWGEPEAQRTFQ
jgi:hypothetical protein